MKEWNWNRRQRNEALLFSFYELKNGCWTLLWFEFGYLKVGVYCRKLHRPPVHLWCLFSFSLLKWLIFGQIPEVFPFSSCCSSVSDADSSEGVFQLKKEHALRVLGYISSWTQRSVLLPPTVYIYFIRIKEKTLYFPTSLMKILICWEKIRFWPNLNLMSLQKGLQEVLNCEMSALQRDHWRRSVSFKMIKLIVARLENHLERDGNQWREFGKLG